MFLIQDRYARRSDRATARGRPNRMLSGGADLPGPSTRPGSVSSTPSLCASPLTKRNGRVFTPARTWWGESFPVSPLHRLLETPLK